MNKLFRRGVQWASFVLGVTVVIPVSILITSTHLVAKNTALVNPLTVTGEAVSTGGLLRVSSENPRYFTDESGQVVYLTGSHTWANLQDYGASNPPPVFDYKAYLDFLQPHDHNFIRL